MGGEVDGAHARAVECSCKGQGEGDDSLRM